jgi:hypothetical protein
MHMTELDREAEGSPINKLLKFFGQIDRVFSGKASTANISRRRFLQILSGATATSILAASNLRISSDKKLNLAKEITTDTTSPSVAPELLSEYEPVAFENITVYLDSKKIPFAYRFAVAELSTQENAVTYFTDDQRSLFLESLNSSKETGVPQTVFFSVDDLSSQQSLWDVNRPDPSTPERPWVTEKPPTVVDSETLKKKYDLKVVTAGGDVPQLDFLQSAFEENGILQPLAIVNNDQNRMKRHFGMQITLINSPLYSDRWLTIEQRATLPESTINYLHEKGEFQIDAIERYRADLYAELTALLVTALDEFAQFEGEDKKIVERKIIELKQHMVLTRQLSTLEFYTKYRDVILTIFYDVEWVQASTSALTDDRDVTHIVAAAGDGGVLSIDKVFFSYNSQGEFGINKINNLNVDHQFPGMDLLPTVDRSFPRNEDFTQFKSAIVTKNSYLFDAETVADLLRHEIYHAWLIDWLPIMRENDQLNDVRWLIVKIAERFFSDTAVDPNSQLKSTTMLKNSVCLFS